MQIGRIKITASRWPWQTPPRTLSDKGPPRKYGWGKVGGWGRFGGGWEWELGIQASTSTVIINLIFGTIRICWYKKKEI